MTVKATPASGVEEFFQSSDGQAEPSPNGRAPSFEPPSPFDPGGQISIDIGHNHLPTMTALCWEAIKKGNKPPVLFRHVSRIVRVMRDANHNLWLQTVAPEVLRNELSNWAHWHKHEIKLAKPPLDVMTNVLMERELPVPILRGIAGAPVFGPDGSLNLTPGFDDKSGIYYAPRPGFTVLPVPDEVAKDDLDKANKLLCDEVLVDFPFASVADRDNAVALFILSFARDLVEGPTPNHLIESSMNASGKGKLSNALLYPLLGRPLGIVADPHDERELAKEITTQLVEGKPVVLFDNFTNLNSSSLAALWTGAVWDKRILGTQTIANIEIRTIWITTGKNVQMTSEMARRCVRSRLTPHTDRPEERQDFKHPELETWCAGHRAQLVWAAHVIIKWWIQAGRPKSSHGRCLGSFEAWSRVIGGILECAGYTNFLANHREFQSKSDTERNARSAFCTAWFKWVQVDKARRFYSTATELLPLSKGVEGLPIRGNTPRAELVSLGMYLGSNADVHVECNVDGSDGQVQTCQLRIGRGEVKQGKQLWFVEKVGEEFLQGLPLHGT